MGIIFLYFKAFAMPSSSFRPTALEEKVVVEEDQVFLTRIYNVLNEVKSSKKEGSGASAGDQKEKVCWKQIFFYQWDPIVVEMPI